MSLRILSTTVPARPTASIIESRDVTRLGEPRTTYRIFDDGSWRHDGGHKRFGKALRRQQRRAKA